MAYKILVQRRASKAFLALDGPVRSRVSAAIDALANDPRPPGAITLVGMVGVLRSRVGAYRVLYEVQRVSSHLKAEGRRFDPAPDHQFCNVIS